MIDHLEGKFCIDKNRVYASGKSNGGGFSARVLACDSRASKKIAAFAGVAGACKCNAVPGSPWVWAT